jgi:hypothetical protein
MKFIVCRGQWGTSLWQDDLKDQVQHCLQNGTNYTGIFITCKALQKNKMNF